MPISHGGDALCSYQASLHRVLQQLDTTTQLTGVRFGQQSANLGHSLRDTWWTMCEHTGTGLKQYTIMSDVTLLTDTSLHTITLGYNTDNRKSGRWELFIKLQVHNKLNTC